MKLSDCGYTDEIFEHLLHGRRRFFNASRLNEYASRHGERLLLPIEPDWIEYIEKFRGIEQERVERLREPWLSAPVLLVGEADGSTLTIDGHHRLVRLYRDGAKCYRAYFLPLGSWEWCLVDDLPANFTFGVVAE